LRAQDQVAECVLVVYGVAGVLADYAVYEFYRQANAVELREDVHSADRIDADSRCAADLDQCYADGLDRYDADGLDRCVVDDLDQYAVDDPDLCVADVLDRYDADVLDRYDADGLDLCCADDHDQYGVALDPYADDHVDQFALDVVTRMFLNVPAYVGPDFYYVGSC
jgi:hypothetical protein